MPTCPDCGRQLTTVLRYRADRQRTYYAYECSACREQAARAEQGQPQPDPDQDDARLAIEKPRTTLGDLLFAKPIPPPMPESEWVALVRAVATGDASALYTLYARLQRIVFTLMLRTSRAREIAERLTLDTFTDISHRASAYDPMESSAIGWILNQARSRAIHHLKTQGPSPDPRDPWVARPMDQLPTVLPMWERLATRIAADRNSVMPAMPGPAPAFDWQDAGPGISYKVLAQNVEKGHISMLVRLAAGAAYPPHTHAGLEELYLLDGELFIDHRKLVPGDYNRAEAGTADQHVWSQTGCTCVLLTSTRDVLR